MSLVFHFSSLMSQIDKMKKTRFDEMKKKRKNMTTEDILILEMKKDRRDFCEKIKW